MRTEEERLEWIKRRRSEKNEFAWREREIGKWKTQWTLRRLSLLSFLKDLNFLSIPKVSSFDFVQICTFCNGTLSLNLAYFQELPFF